MTIGFLPKHLQPSENRRPVRSVQDSRVVGWIAQHDGNMFIADASGSKIAKVLRWKDGRAPWCNANAQGFTVIQPNL